VQRQIKTSLTSEPKRVGLGIGVTQNQGHGVFIQLCDAVGHEADGTALVVGGNGRDAEAAVLLVRIDAKPIMAVGQLEVELGLKVAD
jgi:hypothetical protein